MSATCSDWRHGSDGSRWREEKHKVCRQDAWSLCCGLVSQTKGVTVLREGHQGQVQSSAAHSVHVSCHTSPRVLRVWALSQELHVGFGCLEGSGECDFPSLLYPALLGVPEASLQTSEEEVWNRERRDAIQLMLKITTNIPHFRSTVKGWDIVTQGQRWLNHTLITPWP